MADRAVSQLPAVTAMGVTDLFLLEQSGNAKKLTGQLLKTTLLAWLDGHGGIKDITFNDDDTMTITAADDAAWTSDSLRGPDGVSPTVDVMQSAGTPTTYIITITDKDGEHTFSLHDGDKGAKGDIGIHGSDVSVTVSDAAATPAHPGGGKVLTITETSYSAGGPPVTNSTRVTIWNGKDGTSIQSIDRTDGTGAAGTTDTYTVTLTDGSKTTFKVYNGRDGDGAGDMTQAVYDPQGRAQDIFAYADAIRTALDDKQSKITASGILKGNGSGGVSAASEGVDYAAPSQSAAATLTAAGWSDGEQTVSVSAVTSVSNGSLRIAQSATDEQFAAWCAAQPRVTAQAANTITIKAAGTVPTIDIPVEVLIV